MLRGKKIKGVEVTSKMSLWKKLHINRTDTLPLSTMRSSSLHLQVLSAKSFSALQALKRFKFKDPMGSRARI